MFKMFNQIFAAITVLAAAMEKLANSVLHLSTAAEQQAKAFAEEQDLDNQIRLDEIRARREASKSIGKEPITLIQ